MYTNNEPVALFNGTVATTNGLYKISDITLEDAIALVRSHGFISAIGHDATADIMSDLLDIHVSMNRIQFHQRVGQKAIVFKLNERPDEGIILTQPELEQIGYTLKLMERME